MFLVQASQNGRIWLGPGLDLKVDLENQRICKVFGSYKENLSNSLIFLGKLSNLDLA
jgi:hypothetical protein